MIGDLVEVDFVNKALFFLRFKVTQNPRDAQISGERRVEQGVAAFIGAVNVKSTSKLVARRHEKNGYPPGRPFSIYTYQSNFGYLTKTFFPLMMLMPLTGALRRRP